MIHMFWALLQLDLPLDPDENPKDISQKEKDQKVDLDYWLAVTWNFGAATDADGHLIMDKFIRDLMMGEMVQEKYDLICHDPPSRPVARCQMPEGGQVYDYYPNMSNGKLEPWTKKITGFDIPKNAQPHTIMVPTSDTVRSAFLLQTLTAGNYHTLFTGLTGTGKTVVIQQELLKNFDKE